MVTVTVNGIKDGVVSALESKFPDIPVMAEWNEQSVEVPRFFVALLATQQTAMLGPRVRRVHTFDIQYFPETNSNGSMHAIAERLYEHLEWIEIDGMNYRGIGMSHEIADGVLHFKIDIRYNAIRAEEPVPLMQTMKQEENVNDGQK